MANPSAFSTTIAKLHHAPVADPIQSSDYTSMAAAAGTVTQPPTRTTLQLAEKYSALGMSEMGPIGPVFGLDSSSSVEEKSCAVCNCAAICYHYGVLACDVRNNRSRAT